MKNLLAQGMPRRPPDSDEEQDEEQNWEGLEFLDYCDGVTKTCKIQFSIEQMAADVCHVVCVILILRSIITSV